MTYRVLLSAMLVASLVSACSSDSNSSNDAANNANSANSANSANAANAANNANSANAANNANSANAANNVNSANSLEGVTYWQHIAPILEGRCSTCHMDGGIGPFALESYEDAKPLAGLIAQVVGDRTMPPFLPQGECNEFQHDPRLTDDQVAQVRAWADAGAPEGDEADKGEALPSLGAVGLSRVDKTLTMDEPYTPQKEPDDYRCFVLDWELAQDTFVTGFGVDPGEDDIVHHIIAYYIEPGDVAEAEALDASEEGPGYSCFGGPRVGGGAQANWLGSWAPGGQATDFPEGTGLEVKAGSKVVVQVHYNTLGSDPKPDQSSVLFKLDDQVRKRAEFLLWASPQWLSGSMNIPAGDPDVKHSFRFDATQFYSDGQPINFYSGFIHMHLLGKSGRATILKQGGGEDCLIDIPRYDFNWQAGVAFKDVVQMQPGDALQLECHWDNTMANQPVVDGQQTTPQDRSWGDGSTDEMCLGVFYVTYGVP